MTIVLFLKLQSDLLLQYAVCILRMQRKDENLRNDQGDIYTKRRSERTLIYPRFQLHGLDPGMHLENSLQKVSKIVAKNHNH